MKYRVFVSSTTRDLAEYREAALDVLRKKTDDVEVVAMEAWVAHDDSSMEVCRKKIQGSPETEQPACDIFVALIGHFFGSAPKAKSDRSYTMLEYDWAVEAGIPVLMHCATDDLKVDAGLLKLDGYENFRRQLAFREELAERHQGQPASWRRPYQLASDVGQAVQNKITELRRERGRLTPEKLANYLTQSLKEIDAQLVLASSQKRLELLTRRDEVEGEINTLQDTYNKHEKTIKELRKTVDGLADGGSKTLAEASKALEEQDVDTADALFEKFLEQNDALIDRIAVAYQGRGAVASIRSQFQEARWNNLRAAQIAPNFERLGKIAIFLMLNGEKEDAVEALKMQIDAARHEFGEDHEKVSVALGNVANFIFNSGKAEEAERFYGQALSLAEEYGRRDTEVYAFHQIGVAIVFRSQERLNEAAERLHIASRGWEQLSSSNQVLFVTEVVNLAGAYFNADDHANVERVSDLIRTKDLSDLEIESEQVRDAVSFLLS